MNMNLSMAPKMAIVGSGPAGLMAATELKLRNPQAEIHLFERRPSLGRKLLIAGSSGLNISHVEEDMETQYSGFSVSHWKNLLEEYSVQDWLQFIENTLGLETFLGTSKRYFVRDMKGAQLLKNWTELLIQQGVKVHAGHELKDFLVNPTGVHLWFEKDHKQVAHSFQAAAFCLGGGSWEDSEPSWCALFREKKIGFTPMVSSNCGYEIAWNEKFLHETEGKPLKKVVFKTALGEKMGDLMVTRYGLEGTAVYTYGTVGTATIDLIPEYTLEQIISKMSYVTENFSPMRRVKHYLGLCEASLNLIFHYAPKGCELRGMAEFIKKVPLELLRPRPLIEAISTKGGVALSELSETYELNKFPGIFCAGEMQDWDAPTGGFLIQASVSQGARVGRAMAEKV